jgi:hypothetical protein
MDGCLFGVSIDESEGMYTTRLLIDILREDGIGEDTFSTTSSVVKPGLTFGSLKN